MARPFPRLHAIGSIIARIACAVPLVLLSPLLFIYLLVMMLAPHESGHGE